MAKPIIYHPNQIIDNGLIFLHWLPPYISPKGTRIRRASVKCVCGCVFETILAHIRAGKTVSCGCYNKARARGTHNLSRTNIYYVWMNMRCRCRNRKNAEYKNYGGRGISVCEEWQNDFMSFYNWAITNGYKKGLTIDRVDNDGNYEPSNCRFVTNKKNNRNKRTTKLNWDTVNEIRNARLLLGDLTSYAEMARAYGVTRQTINDVVGNKTWAD